MSALIVWREYKGDIQRIGTIASINGELRFAYDRDYSGQPISVSLPLQDEPHNASATSVFFSALIPEGSTRREFARILHAEEESFSTYLERLNDESIGALLFSTEETKPFQHARYDRIGSSFFQEFADRPLETAIETMGRTRLSLSGAMAKVGLYCDEITDLWYFPQGGAPSTHIIKAADSKRFPLETLNEALCLGAARRCGLPAANCKLIAVDGAEPLLAVKRFDRTTSKDTRNIDGLPAPLRLHQEDFLQASSIPLKYEPTDANYLEKLTSVARASCANAFGEASLLFEYTIFHYLIGNCDNHLKNYSLLYSSSWDIREVAPLYDVLSTVLYPEIYLEMGVSFGGSRRILDVNRKAIESRAAECGIPKSIAISTLKELSEKLPQAIMDEAEALYSEGFTQVKGLSKSIRAGIADRIEAVK